MKTSILKGSTSQREDDQRYTAQDRAFETVLRYLDEPRRDASPAPGGESTKKILKIADTHLGGSHPTKRGSNVSGKGQTDAGDVSALRRD
jgi:hypothetical protein